MSPTRQSSSFMRQWLPFIAATAFQFLGFVWFAAHLSDQTNQNTKDIESLKAMVLPKEQIMEQNSNLKERLESIDHKLDLVLERPQVKQ